MEEREKVRPAEPQARPAEADVEVHSTRPAENEEPRSEGDSDDDVETHKVRPA